MTERDILGRLSRVRKCRGGHTALCPEYCFLPGELLSGRWARQDEELDVMRGDIGARGEPTDRQARPQFNDRLHGLLLDALAPIEAAIGSAVTGLPYSALRTVTAFDEDGRRELLRAAQAAAAAHPDLLAEHRSAIEFLVSLMAITAAQVDQLFALVDAERAGSGHPPQACLPREALMIGLIVLAPVVLLAGLAVYRLIKKG